MNLLINIDKEMNVKFRQGFTEAGGTREQEQEMGAAACSWLLK